jgi:hypothetical protein
MLARLLEAGAGGLSTPVFITEEDEFDEDAEHPSR